MSKITGVALLLIILAETFYDSTASNATFYVSKEHIRKCGCRVFPKGKIKCRFPVIPTKHEEKLMRCLCSETNRHKFPEIQAACTSGHLHVPSTPL